MGPPGWSAGGIRGGARGLRGGARGLRGGAQEESGVRCARNPGCGAGAPAGSGPWTGGDADEAGDSEALVRRKARPAWRALARTALSKAPAAAWAGASGLPEPAPQPLG